MFRPAAFFIGLRYTRAKKRNHFISFISLTSMIGIALGVMVLITVLSVMNGFDKEIRKRVFSMVPAITVSNTTGAVSEWQALQNNLQQQSYIVGSAPFVSGQILLTHDNVVQPAMLSGILPQEEKKMSVLSEKMVQGRLDALSPHTFGMVLGEDLADRLGVGLGDKVTVITPQVSVSIAGISPRIKRFSVVGIFRAGTGFAFDSNYAFIHLNDAQTLLTMGNTVTGLHLSIQNVYAAPMISQKLTELVPPTLRVSNWTDLFGEYFHAIKLEKTMMFLILLMIIAVAVFNLVSTLVMVVNEKKSDIAILRTFGATPRMIMNIFIVQGAIIGITGTVLGVICGILMAWNVTAIVNGIEHLFHVQLLSSDIYFVNYLPSELVWYDVWRISSWALGLSLLATLYPAWRAAKTDPVEALRYE